MELRHLRYFVAVAEEKHFGRAAARLHIAQPPLSRQIQSLERELGFSLLERNRRGVELTSAGEVLLAQGRRVLEAADLALRETRRAHAGERGRLVVGYPSSLTYSGIAALLRSYRARHPEVELTLRELPPTEQLDALRQGQLDVGFVRAPFDEPSLSAECYRRESVLVALPLGHAQARRKRVSLRTLAREPFVAFPRPRSPGFFDQLTALCREAGFSPRIVQESALADLLSLVEAGFGVALVPEGVRQLRRAGVVLRPLEGDPHTELLVVWRHGRPGGALQGFLEVARRVASGAKGARGRALVSARVAAEKAARGGA